MHIAKKKSNILSLFFISVMHFSNGAKFSNIVFLLVLLASVDIAFASVIVPCTSVHALLLSHKPDFSVEFLNLILLFELHAPFLSWAISTQYIVLNKNVWSFV